MLPEGDVCAPFFSGACFLVRRDLFLRLGGFDENIFLFYEDDDLCRRIADGGLSLVYVPQAVVTAWARAVERAEAGADLQGALASGLVARLCRAASTGCRARRRGMFAINAAEDARRAASRSADP